MSCNSSEMMKLEPTQGHIRRHHARKLGEEWRGARQEPTWPQQRKALILSFSLLSLGSAATWERHELCCLKAESPFGRPCIHGEAEGSAIARRLPKESLTKEEGSQKT